MKYFLDQEFIERFHKSWFDKKLRHVIDLISIGIVAEDGREYQAISREYKYKDASDWVKQNVILPLYLRTVHGDARNHWDVHNFHIHYGKSNKQIAQEIFRFVNPIMGEFYDPLPVDFGYISKHNCKEFDDGMGGKYVRAQPDLYGYYADYDWVLLCSLFGTMMQLPEGFPMYCIDLKQMLDGKVRAKYKPGDSKENFEKALEHMKLHPDYPKQSNEHDAISDAKWNRDLYNFLMS